MNKRKSILVTSGSKRLGKHISKFFVMNDWDLILHYNNSKVEAEETPEAETIASEQTETPSDLASSEEEEVKAEKPKKKIRAKAKKSEKEAEPSAEEKQEDSVEEETETS